MLFINYNVCSDVADRLFYVFIIFNGIFNFSDFKPCSHSSSLVPVHLGEGQLAEKSRLLPVHYANMLMHYAGTFKGCKNDHF